MDKLLLDSWMIFGAGFALGGLFAFYIIITSFKRKE